MVKQPDEQQFNHRKLIKMKISPFSMFGIFLSVKVTIFAIVTFLSGCSEPMPQCSMDSDCNNGSHCNLFFRACEVDVYDASLSDSPASESDSSIPDAGISSEADSFVGDADAPSSIEDALGAILDASVEASNFALRFDGDGDKVTLTPISGMTQNFTFEAWVRPTNATYVSDVGGFIFQRRSSSRDVTLFFSRNSDSRFGFQVNGTIVRANHESFVDEWHHVAGVLYNGDVSIFVDGVLEGRVSGDQMVQWILPSGYIQEFVIGREGIETDAHRGVFIGEIDQIRISSISRYIEDAYEVPESFVSDSSVVAMFELNDSDSVVHSSVGAVSGSLIGAQWVPCDR